MSKMKEYEGFLIMILEMMEEKVLVWNVTSEIMLVEVGVRREWAIAKEREKRVLEIRDCEDSAASLLSESSLPPSLPSTWLPPPLPCSLSAPPAGCSPFGTGDNIFWNSCKAQSSEAVGSVRLLSLSTVLTRQCHRISQGSFGTLLR